MMEKSEESVTALLQRAAALQRKLDKQHTLPRPDVLVSFIGDLARVVADLQEDRDVLEQEYQSLLKQKNSLERQNRMIEQRYRSTEQQNLSLKREKYLLEKRCAEMELKTEAITKERKRYRDLFEYAPDAYLITCPHGTIEEANRSAMELLNVHPGELVGLRLSDFIATDDQSLFETLLARKRRVQGIEVSISPRNLPSFDASITMSSVYGDDGHPVRLRWQLRDVTDRRRAMDALNVSERRFRAIFNEANLGIVLVDLDGQIVRANRAFQEMLGYTEEELYGRLIEDLIHPEDQVRTPAAAALQDNALKQRKRLERRYCRKDGSVVWFSTIFSTLNDEQGRPQYIMRLVENVTNEKQARSELAEMRRRLLESGEVERLRLAQELHDGPMQDLYGAVFRLSNFQDQTGDPEMRANLAEAQGILKQVAGKIRTICGELRPPTIANLGLERAIRSHAERIQENHPELDLQLHLSTDGQSLSANTRLAFFRIYQQCMANVLNHAQANQVMVAFHMNENEIAMDVWDNGKGFTLPERWLELLREGHYGLASIAERVQALGGTIKIETKPGGGTLVHVTVPRIS